MTPMQRQAGAGFVNRFKRFNQSPLRSKNLRVKVGSPRLRFYDSGYYESDYYNRWSRYKYVIKNLNPPYKKSIFKREFAELKAVLADIRKNQNALLQSIEKNSRDSKRQLREDIDLIDYLDSRLEILEMGNDFSRERAIEGIVSLDIENVTVQLVLIQCLGFSLKKSTLELIKNTFSSCNELDFLTENALYWRIYHDIYAEKKDLEQSTAWCIVKGRILSPLIWSGLERILDVCQDVRKPVDPNRVFLKPVLVLARSIYNQISPRPD